MIKIDQNLCNACGICSQVCPRHIPEMIDKDNEKIMKISRERIGLCMDCGHCMAVCPKDAIRVKSLSKEKFIEAQKPDIVGDQLISLFKHRRSVRRYKDKPVPREIIDKIIEAAHTSPTGTGRRSTGVIIIDDPKTLKELSELGYRTYEDLEKNLKNPIARFFIKKRIGKKTFDSLNDFVMPGMHWYMHWYREGKSNEILRDCPVLILFHSPINEPMGDGNCIISAFHAIMMAQIMGVGTCFNDLIPPVCNRSREIRDLLNLPDDREVYASITLGYSKYKFKRTPPRKLAEVRYIK
ncbi:MAG: nitroreductase family protein [Methanosarcinales archaeon]|nr:nitroreductase family protein [Methanosarcinales archaeon]